MKIANVFACAIWLVAAATPSAAEPGREVTIEDYFSLATVTQLSVSPDGRHVAYCEARWQHEYLHVPTELVVYPGEPHGLAKYTSRKAKMGWDLAWFQKYLRGK